MKYLITYIWISCTIASFAQSILTTENADTTILVNSPFDCSPGFYQVINGRLNILDPLTGNYNPLGPTHFKINAIGYNINDDFIYGICREDGFDSEGTAVVEGDLIRLDSNGLVKRIASTGIVYSNAGDVWNNNLYLKSSNNLHRIDLTDGTTTQIATDFTPNDLAISDDGIGYGMKNATLFVVDLNEINPVVNQIAIPTFCNGDALPLFNTGACWITDDEAGGTDFYFSNNTGPIYRITEPNSPTPCAEFVLDGAVASSNDGASCPSAVTPIISFTLDFDGVDDYVSAPSCLNGLSEASQMAWIRLNTDFDTKGTVMGQQNFKIWVENDGMLAASIITDSGTFTVSSNVTITNNIWTHVAAIYDGSNLKLYINGEEENLSSAHGTTSHVLGNFELGRNAIGNDYLHTFIDDARVYNIALNEKQLQEQVYQEILTDQPIIRGAVIPKEIEGLSSSNLVLYLKMDPINFGKVIDQSDYNRDGTLHNITTIQEQNAPMPYVANNTGNWTDTNTWEHGDIWDITTATENKDWSIVHIQENTTVNTVNSHTQLGMLIDENATLQVQGDHSISNTSYLRLNGLIDLESNAQLIQTINSDLDPTSSGAIEIDQQGKSDIYSYNYWSSPVGHINTFQNNQPFTINEVLRDGTLAHSPLPITWITGLDGQPTTPISLSSSWIYSFNNQSDLYQNWELLGATNLISPGMGYTMKGPGTGTNTNGQNYTFMGKPNNGDISHSISSGNLSFVGNPYPSAINADQFIIDNQNTIVTDGDVIGENITTGALYFWEHFSTNNSHYFHEYEGGYATYNLAGATIAVPDADVSANGTGSILPNSYIPVGQGFFVESATSGTIEFNNGQRAYANETDGNSIFMFTTPDTSSATQRVSAPNPLVDRIYFNFTMPNGAMRQLLLARKDGATLGIDYGLDARMIGQKTTDASWNIEGAHYVIQTIEAFSPNLKIPLQINASTSGLSSFEIETLQGIPEELLIYFVDSQTGTITNLRSQKATFQLDAENYSNRFYLEFKTQNTPIPIENNDPFIIYYSSANKQIEIISDLAFNLISYDIINTLGQVIQHKKTALLNQQHVILPITLNKGVYLFRMEHNKGEIIKKIRVD